MQYKLRRLYRQALDESYYLSSRSAKAQHLQDAASALRKLSVVLGRLSDAMEAWGKIEITDADLQKIRQWHDDAVTLLSQIKSADFSALSTKEREIVERLFSDIEQALNDIKF